MVLALENASESGKKRKLLSLDDEKLFSINFVNRLTIKPHEPAGAKISFFAQILRPLSPSLKCLSRRVISPF